MPGKLLLDPETEVDLFRLRWMPDRDGAMPAGAVDAALALAATGEEVVDAPFPSLLESCRWVSDPGRKAHLIVSGDGPVDVEAAAASADRALEIATGRPTAQERRTELTLPPVGDRVLLRPQPFDRRLRELSESRPRPEAEALERVAGNLEAVLRGSPISALQGAGLARDRVTRLHGLPRELTHPTHPRYAWHGGRFVVVQDLPTNTVWEVLFTRWPRRVDRVALLVRRAGDRPSEEELAPAREVMGWLAELGRASDVDTSPAVPEIPPSWHPAK